ncbi:MAG: tRNA threonylcarbamoyladenosine dehydratase [Bacteroidota bacterium]
MTSEHWQERTVLLVGNEKLEELRNKHVLIAGLGGVGAYAAEQLCRAGVGELTLVDGDAYHVSNINRQLGALHSTLGLSKTQVMAQRLRDINPDIIIHVIQEFIRDEHMVELLQSADYDYVVDAIDTLSPKIFLIYHCVQLGLPIVSSMGAGGKTDPAKIVIADLAKSYNCKLAYQLRKRLRKLGVKKGVKVVFSAEKMDDNAVIVDYPGPNKKSTVGTISYMPPLFGGFMASVVLREFLTLADEQLV